MDWREGTGWEWEDGEEKRNGKCSQVVKLKQKIVFFLFVKFLSKNKIAIVKEIQFLCQACVYLKVGLQCIPLE